MIQGYSDESSAFPGETITFRVSSPDASQFRIDFYRQGATFDFQLSTDWMPGSPADERPDDQDWSTPGTNLAGQPAPAWPAYPFQIPTNWQTGVYIAMFIEGDGNGNPNPNQNPPIDTTTPDARSGKALFVVKNPVPGVASQVLYMLPLFTYAAYNPKGGRSVYQGGAVSLHRPGNGTGGLPWDADPTFIGRPNIDVFDPNTFRQTFVHWDAKFISWLEGPAQGYRLDYCTSLDIHNDDTLSLLSPYALVLSVGHDEYYSPKMRDHLEAYIANGGNMAFFSGNTSWWQVVFSDLQNPVIFNRDYNWYQGPLQNLPNGPNRPEDALTGVSYRNATEQDYDRAKVGYTVQHTNLWPFENTGLKEGDTFGQDQGLVGYECDGTPFDKAAPHPVSPQFDPNDHTPASFVILGIGDTSVWPEARAITADQGFGNLAATMGMYTTSGTAFTGATTDWPRVVWQGEPHTVQITKNVINRLGGNLKGLATLMHLDSVLACDGFFSPDDSYRHAIVGTSAGSITEIFFNSQSGQGQAQLTDLNGLLDLGAFYSNDDQYRHVIAATSDGNIREIFYSPKTGQGQAVLANVPNVIRVSGFFSPDDNFRHAIVATADGRVIEIFFNPTQGQGQTVLGTFQGIVDIGSFFSPDDNFRHVLVGTDDGNVTEIYYNPNTGISQAVIANIPGLIRVSSYYAAGDQFFNRRVQVVTSGGRIHEVRYHPNFGIMRSVLFNTSGLLDLGSFFSPDDSFRHTILATASSDIQELFFRP